MVKRLYIQILYTFDSLRFESKAAFDRATILYCVHSSFHFFPVMLCYKAIIEIRNMHLE